jgi:hypothetical protein
MHPTKAMALAAEMGAAGMAAPEAVPCEGVVSAMIATAVMATPEVAAAEAVAPAAEMTAAMTATSVTSASAAFPQRRTRHHGRDNQNGNSNEGLRHGIPRCGKPHRVQ